MKEKLGCLAIAVAVLGIIFLIIFLSDTLSSPKEVEAKIEAAIRSERFNHVYFEDQDALQDNIEKHGYSKNPKEVLQQEHDAGFKEGYDYGYSDGIWSSYDEGYWEGYQAGYEDGANGEEYLEP